MGQESYTWCEYPIYDFELYGYWEEQPVIKFSLSYKLFIKWCEIKAWWRTLGVALEGKNYTDNIYWVFLQEELLKHGKKNSKDKDRSKG